MSGSSTTLTNSDNNLRRDTPATSVVLDGRSLYEFMSGDKEELRSKAREWRKWSIEFQNSGLEESYQLGVPFFCFSVLFSSLLHTVLLH